MSRETIVRFDESKNQVYEYFTNENDVGCVEATVNGTEDSSGVCNTQAWNVLDTGEAKGKSDLIEVCNGKENGSEKEEENLVCKSSNIADGSEHLYKSIKYGAQFVPNIHNHSNKEIRNGNCNIRPGNNDAEIKRMEDKRSATCRETIDSSLKKQETLSDLQDVGLGQPNTFVTSQSLLQYSNACYDVDKRYKEIMEQLDKDFDEFYGKEVISSEKFSDANKSNDSEYIQDVTNDRNKSLRVSVDSTAISADENYIQKSEKLGIPLNATLTNSFRMDTNVGDMNSVNQPIGELTLDGAHNNNLKDSLEKFGDIKYPISDKIAQLVKQMESHSVYSDYDQQLANREDIDILTECDTAIKTLDRMIGK